MLIDFGNGTRLWFNGTRVPITDNFYNVTYEDVKGGLSSTPYGYPLDAHFVYKIIGYGCNSGDLGCKGYWSLWVWNGTVGCWAYSTVGVDLLKVSEVAMMAWYFTNTDQNSFTGSCR